MTTARTSYALAFGLALLTVLFLILAIGALGIIGDGGRPDRIYAAVLAVLAVGTVIARLRPRGMALALAATAAAQALVTAAALLGGLHDDGDSIVDILGINAMYVVLFGVSAWLFRRAAEQNSAVAVNGRA
jgi:hypothetical protein